MGKPQVPLVQIPCFLPNRTANNGRLLRKPQPRKLEPLRQCLTPDSSPEPHAVSPDPDLLAEEQDAVDDWLLAVNIEPQHVPAGHTTPIDPPQTVRRYRPRPAPSQEQQTSREYDGQMTQEMAEAYMSLVKSRPMPTASAKVLLHTTVHAGPQGLPPPKPRKPRSVIPYETVMEKGPSELSHMQTLNLGSAAENDPALRVNEFFKEVAKDMSISQECIETVMFSRSNFEQLTQLVHEQLSVEANRKKGKITHKNLNQQISQKELPYRPSSHAVTGSRVPQTQILIQMASMLTEQIQATAEGRNIRALIRPFPKWAPSKPIDEMPRAEIILYEQADTPTEENNLQLVVRGEGQDTPGVIMRHTSEKHFMDSKRNRTPFDFAGEGGLDPTDIAVLDALVTGGAVLSLKAHFIETMPDVCPITQTLRYLNLSFNNFTMIPPEVLTLTHLEVLKLRNNPISEIPDEIRHLRYLRTFEIPFCLISEVPQGLLTLIHLQYLDLSYNKLTFLPDKIKQLQSLQVLFVEGNQLVALPCACLAIPNLRYIRVRNNFMHPIFWPGYMKDNDEPQSLRDLSGLLMKQLDLDTRYGSKLPKAAKDILSSGRTCDCCHGPMIGNGLTIIRPGSIYGVKNVPFMFKSCSHYCSKLFTQNKARLSELVLNYTENLEE
ncbi:uncharacterized protein [Watersipora subatra]|uniref:uncharacterized protein n=1 Tax=Watersipora subatra TaxID=2589382 RepID=UPI00355BD245